MLPRFKNTILYIVLLIVELIVYFFMVGGGMNALFIVLGLAQLGYFLPRIIAEFRYEEQ